MRSASRRALAGAVAIGLATTAFATVAQADEAPPPPGDVVATGLDNPRHLTVAPNGDLYVAEAGSGGGDCVDWPTGEVDDEGNIIRDDEGNPITMEICAGSSGAITLLSHKGAQQRVVTGLPSTASPAGDVVGPSDVSIKGKTLTLTVGLGADPALRAAMVAAHGDFYAGLATVQQAKMMGKKVNVTQLADLGQFEEANNPHKAAVDSNPNAVSADGNGWLLADAGGNDVMRLDNKGNLSLIGVLPDSEAALPDFVFLPDPPPPFPVIVPVEPVPTSIERGRDGAIYVSQLTGFPFPVGGSSIWRIAPDGSMSEWATGLTNVTDLTFGPDGSLYAVQIANEGLTSESGLGNGSLLRVGPGAGNVDVIATGLFAAYGVAVYKDYAYVTTGSVTPVGQVLRFDLD